MCCCIKSIIQSRSLPFALMLTVCAPVCSAAHEAKGSNGFGAGAASAKHPVFLGSSIIDILQTSCDPESFIPSPAPFASLSYIPYIEYAAGDLCICTEFREQASNTLI